MQNVQRWPVVGYLLVNAAAGVAGAVIGRRYPDLVKERMHPGPGALESFAATVALYGGTWAAHLLVAAFDRLRWHRSDTVPFGLRILGLVGFALANGIIVWAMLVNRFFSSAVRIQHDRGQVVVSAGPYHTVRHPGYAAGVFYAPMGALALGSWLSLLSSLLFCLAIVRRTAMEDRLLHDALPGYTEYAARVRYRLIPGLW